MGSTWIATWDFVVTAAALGTVPAFSTTIPTSTTTSLDGGQTPSPFVPSPPAVPQDLTSKYPNAVVPPPSQTFSFKALTPSGSQTTSLPQTQTAKTTDSSTNVKSNSVDTSPTQPTTSRMPPLSVNPQSITTSASSHVGSISSGGTASVTNAKGTSSGSPSPDTRPSPKPNNTGLTAAVGVLAGLLVLALLALGFLISRRRRRSSRAFAPPQTYADPSELEGSASEGTASTAGQKGFASTGRGHAKELAALPFGLDDRTVNARFSQLDSAIQDWVVASFRAGLPVPPEDVSPETAALLGKVSSDWAALLAGDSRGRFLLLRGLVATILSEAWTRGELISDDQLSQLAAQVAEGVSSRQSHLWQAQTLSFLASTPTHRAARAASVDRLTSLLDGTAASIVIVPQSSSSALGTRKQRLRNVIASASDLALELGQQRVVYHWFTSVGMSKGFDAGDMDDVLQEQRSEKLEGRRVRAVVFPGVRRWGDEEGGAWDRSLSIKKGLVLI